MDDDYSYVLPLCFQLGFVDYGQLGFGTNLFRVDSDGKDVV